MSNEPNNPTPKVVNMEFLLKKTISDKVAGEVKSDRELVFEALLQAYEDTGSKSFVVKLPNGDKVATFTITEPKAKEVTNEAELAEWLENNGYGDQVDAVEIPARVEKHAKPGALDAIGAQLVPDTGEFVTPAGEVVEGIQLAPAPKPTAFSVRYEKGAQDRVIGAWQQGELAEVDAGAALPQIGYDFDMAGEVVDDEPAANDTTEGDDNPVAEGNDD